MFHGKIAIPFRNTTLVLSVEEAEGLFAKLKVKLDQHKQGEQLVAPRVTDDGYLTREAVYAFFSQIYEEGESLRTHAGKLYARLISAVGYKALDLKIKCLNCGTTSLDTPSCLQPEERYHRYPSEQLGIEVESLKRLSRESFQEGTKRTGAKTLDDFELIKSYL